MTISIDATTKSVPSTPESVPVARWVPWLFQVGNLTFWLSLYFYVPILPSYAESLGAPLGVVGAMLSAYGVTQLLLRIPTGVASDWWGRRRPVFAAGLVASAAGAVAFYIAPSPWTLVGARAITGLAACAWVGITIMYAGYFAPSESTRAIGWLNLVNATGQVVATWSGGLLAQHYGYGAPFLVSAAVAMVGLACIAFCPEPVRAARTGPPVTLDRLWKTATAPALIGVSLLSAVQNYATFSTVFGFTPVYAERLGATRADLGTLTAVSLIPFALAQPITAWLNRRYGPRNVVVIGLAVIGLTAVTTPLCETLPILLAVQVVAGGARGVVGTTLMGMAIRRVSQSERATAMGVYQAVYAIGMFSGPLIGGLVGEVSGLPMIFISTGAVALVASVVAIRVLRDA